MNAYSTELHAGIYECCRASGIGIHACVNLIVVRLLVVLAAVSFQTHLRQAVAQRVAREAE